MSERIVCEILLPLMISRTSTPKLYTSAFLVSCPSTKYSGAKYPLQRARQMSGTNVFRFFRTSLRLLNKILFLRRKKRELN